MEDEQLIQPGWRLPRSLIERVDQAYHRRKAAGPLAMTKQDFVADLIAGALSMARSQERGTTAARDGA